jgi:hypothetical protein
MCGYQTYHLPYGTNIIGLEHEYLFVWVCAQIFFIWGCAQASILLCVNDNGTNPK